MSIFQSHLLLFSLYLLTSQFTYTQCKSIAIIGAGAAGSSSAFFASQLEGGPHKVDITVFESSDRVGGRAFAVPIPHPHDPSQPPVSVEVGAGIFVTENQYMFNLSKLFNLTFNEVR
jgi:prenylcysteine oxidase / farnesylcysteine lyase